MRCTIENKPSPLLEETRQQGCAQFPCAMYMAKDEGQHVPFITKPHWHDVMEILYFKAGTFQLSINMETYTIQQECFAIIESGMLHAIKSKHDYQESALLFHPTLLSSNNMNTLESQFILPWLHGSLCFPRLITPHDGIFSQLKSYYLHIQTIFEQANRLQGDQYTVDMALDQLQVKAWIMLFIATLSQANMISITPYMPDPKVEALKDVLTYINAHYTEKIYLHQLATMMNFNEQYFSRFFKRVIGKTPMAYINEIKVRHACERLRMTSDSVLSIALASGFSNMSHFIDTFTKLTGLKPLAYRNQYKNELFNGYKEKKNEKTMVA